MISINSILLPMKTSTRARPYLKQRSGRPCRRAGSTWRAGRGWRRCSRWDDERVGGDGEDGRGWISREDDVRKLEFDQHQHREERRGVTLPASLLLSMKKARHAGWSVIGGWRRRIRRSADYGPGHGGCSTNHHILMPVTTGRRRHRAASRTERQRTPFAVRSL